MLAATAGLGDLAKELSVDWVGTIAVISALVEAIAVSIGARQVADKAAASAAGWRALRQDVRIFLDIDLDYVAVDRARDLLQKLTDKQQLLSRDAPVPRPTGLV